MDCYSRAGQIAKNMHWKTKMEEKSCAVQIILQQKACFLQLSGIESLSFSYNLHLRGWICFGNSWIQFFGRYQVELMMIGYLHYSACLRLRLPPPITSHPIQLNSASLRTKNEKNSLELYFPIRVFSDFQESPTWSTYRISIKVSFPRETKESFLQSISRASIYIAGVPQGWISWLGRGGREELVTVLLTWPSCCKKGGGGQRDGRILENWRRQNLVWLVQECPGAAT